MAFDFSKGSLANTNASNKKSGFNFQSGQLTNTGFPTQEPDSVKRNFLQKTAGFLGIEKAGQGLATAIRTQQANTLAQASNPLANKITTSGDQTGNEAGQGLTDIKKVAVALHDLVMQGVPETDPRRIQLTNLLRQSQGQNPITQAQIDPGTTLSNKEVLGSFGNVALNTLGAGTLTGAGTASPAAIKAVNIIDKAVAPFNTSSKLGRIANAGIKGAEFGLAQGTTQGMNDNKSLTDITKQAGISSAIQGGIGFGVQGLSEIGKLLTDRNTTEAIVNKTIGTPKKIIKAGKSPASDIIDQGVPRSKVGLLEQAQKTIDNSENKISEILKTDTRRHNTAPILDQIKQSLMENYRGALDEKDIEEIVKGLPVASLRNSTSMTTGAINDLRKVIDNKYIGSGRWMNSANATPERITALKAAANTLRGIVKESHPDLSGIFDNYGKAITQKTILTDELAKPHILTNMLEALSAAGLGVGTGGFTPTGAAKGLAGFAAIKALLSTPVQTGLAIGLDRAGRLPSTKTGQVVKAGGRILTRRVVQQAQK